MVLGKGLVSSLVELNSRGHIVDMLHSILGPHCGELVGRGHSFLPLSLSVLQTCLHLVVFVVPFIIGLRSDAIAIIQLTSSSHNIFLLILIFYFFILVFFIQWLRFKVAFCNFKSQPFITIASIAISI